MIFIAATYLGASTLLHQIRIEARGKKKSLEKEGFDPSKDFDGMREFASSLPKPKFYEEFPDKIDKLPTL